MTIKSEDTPQSDFINTLPYVALVPYRSVTDVLNNGTNVRHAPKHSLRLDHKGIMAAMAQIEAGAECFDTYIGEHAKFGDFAVLLSVRGPGDDEMARPRPIFLFYSSDCAFIEDGDAPAPASEVDFIDWTEKDIAHVESSI